LRTPALAAAVTAVALFAASGQAQTPARTARPDARGRQVKKLLEQKFEGAVVTSVAKTPYFGLYEAMFDEQIVYTDAKVTYVMVGNVYEPRPEEPHRCEDARALAHSLRQPAARARDEEGQGQRLAQARDLLGRRLPVLRAASRTSSRTSTT
jgi:hypothetical protein